MQRPIKFRAWDGEQMVSPDYIDREGAGWWRSNSIPNSSDKLMQYPGLKDKNGVEIYEWDIVRSGRITGAIHFSEGVYLVEGFTLPQLDTFSGEVYEVIGNIYENPDLLQNAA